MNTTIRPLIPIIAVIRGISVRALLISGAVGLALVLSACVAAPVVEPGVNETLVEEDLADDEAVDQPAAPEPVPVADSATVTATGTMGVMNAPDEYVRGLVLLDYDFENVNGENIGDIEDLLIDLNDGSILFLSVEYGGFLDLGDRDVYLPLSAFTIGPDGGLLLAMAEEQLDTYPEVGDNWPDIGDPLWDSEVNAYWTEQNMTTPDVTNRVMSNVAWASDITDFSLVGWGPVVTNVSDLLINLQSGTADYALIDASGVDATAAAYIVPIQALTYDALNDQVVIEDGISEEVLINAPRLDPAFYVGDEVMDAELTDEIDNAWRELGYDWWDGE